MRGRAGGRIRASGCSFSVAARRAASRPLGALPPRWTWTLPCPRAAPSGTATSLSLVLRPPPDEVAAPVALCGAALGVVPAAMFACASPPRAVRKRRMTRWSVVVAVPCARRRARPGARRSVGPGVVLMELRRALDGASRRRGGELERDIALVLLCRGGLRGPTCLRGGKGNLNRRQARRRGRPRPRCKMT